MYRCNLDSDKSPDGNGFHMSRWQECPWLWLAKLRIRRWIKEDPKAFHAYIEDLSEKRTIDLFGYPDYKIVWEWWKE